MRRPVHSKLPPSALIALPTNQHRDLAAPAQTANGDVLVHGRVVLVGDHVVPDAQQVGHRLVNVARPGPEVLKDLLLLGRVGRHPLGLHVVALEQVGHQDDGRGRGQVRREAVGALVCLRGGAEDVVDKYDGACGVCWARDVWWGSPCAADGCLVMNR